MRFLGFLRTPEPARPGRRVAKPWRVEDLSDEQYETLLELMEWSDMDSSHELVARGDAVVDLLDSLSQ